jgi:hypothetical protein
MSGHPTDGAIGVTLPVEIREGRLDHADAELLVAPFFETHRPLRGPAARVDWRLCGLLSEQLAAGRARGARGEATLLATAGRFATPAVLAFGLGPKPGFGERDLRLAARDLVGCLAGLRLGRVALALPDEKVLGFPLEPAALALLAGVGDGLRIHPMALHLQIYCASSATPVLSGARRSADSMPDGIELRLSRGATDAAPVRQRARWEAPARPRPDAGLTPGV